MKLVLAAWLALATLPAAAPAQVAAPATTTPPTPVTIKNGLGNPGHVSDLNKPAHKPFSKRLDITFGGGAGNGTFVVPAGKLLVITYVSTNVGVFTGANALCDLATTYAGSEVESHLPLSNNGVILGQQVYSSSSPMTVYADPGSTVTLAFLDSDSAHSGGAIVGVYGYLVDATAPSFE